MRRIGQWAALVAFLLVALVTFPLWFTFFTVWELRDKRASDEFWDAFNGTYDC